MMGNKRYRQIRRLETPSPERETNNTQIETPNAGNETLTNSNVIVQERSGDGSSENHLTEPSLISNEIQVWTQIFEQKSNHRFTKMREERDNKLETILKEISTNKSASTVTNPRSETLKCRKIQPSGSKVHKLTHQTLKIRTQKTKIIHTFRHSEMKDLSELHLDATVISNDDSEEE